MIIKAKKITVSFDFSFGGSEKSYFFFSFFGAIVHQTVLLLSSNHAFLNTYNGTNWSVCWRLHFLNVPFSFLQFIFFHVENHPQIQKLNIAVKMLQIKNKICCFPVVALLHWNITKFGNMFSCRTTEQKCQQNVTI